MKRKLAFLGVSLLAAATAFAADFSYTEKTEITGGSLKTMMGIANRLGGRGGPTTSEHRLKGDVMEERSGDTATMIDVAAETMTMVDFKKKEYSKITFAEMADAMKRMTEKLSNSKKDQKSDVNVKWNTKVENTGKTKTIAGVETKETLITTEMQVEDTKNNQSGATEFQVSMWHGSVPGDEAVQAFYKKMAEKLGGRMAMNTNPAVLAQLGGGAGEGMEELSKKMASVQGLPMMTITRMGSNMSGAPSAEAPAAQEQQQSGSGLGGALGGALGGRFGIGRKKQQEQQQQPAAAQSAGGGVLLETTTEVTSFSSAPVQIDAIPANFKEVENPMKKAFQ